MQALPGFFSTTVTPLQFSMPSSLPVISTLFSETIAGAATFGSAALTVITANIIPIGLAFIGVSIALVLLWKKVYGQPVKQEKTVPKNNLVRTATPKPTSSPTPTSTVRPSSFAKLKVNLPNSSTAAFAKLAAAASLSPTAKTPSQPAAEPSAKLAAMPASVAALDSTPVASSPQVPAIDLSNIVPAAVSVASPTSPQQKLSSRETIRSLLTGYGIPELKSTADNQYRTRAREDKIVAKDGAYFCRFNEDHEGYKANELYPILGWVSGKEQNEYLVIAKLAQGMREMQAVLTGYGIPEFKSIADNQYKTRAKEERIVAQDGKYFCRFNEDHDGYKANELYPIVGWMRGQEHNEYLILNQLSAGPAPTTPAPAAPSQGSDVKLVRKRTGKKLSIAQP